MNELHFDDSISTIVLRERGANMTNTNSDKSVEEMFGKRVRELRKEKKLTQSDLAQTSGLHRNYISDTERGQRNISLICMSKLAEGLTCSIKDFFDY